MRQRVIVDQVLVQAFDELLDASRFEADAIIDSGIVDEPEDVAMALFDHTNCMLALPCIFKMCFDQRASRGCGLHLRHKGVNVL